MEKSWNRMEPQEPEKGSRRGQGGGAEGGLDFMLRALRSHGGRGVVTVTILIEIRCNSERV